MKNVIKTVIITSITNGTSQNPMGKPSGPLPSWIRQFCTLYKYPFNLKAKNVQNRIIYAL